MATAVKTLSPPLLDANPGKQKALASTETLFTEVVRFYLRDSADPSRILGQGVRAIPPTERSCPPKRPPSRIS